ncbi:hypothetical protein C8R47DRAFT_261599 [Mycena vitilis]|nr:hypothetical protein C8R47DRAFT_261599 [Mycena vitilis]
MRFLTPASLLAAPFEKSPQTVDAPSLETQAIDIKATHTAATRVALQGSGVALPLFEDKHMQGNDALRTSVIQQLSEFAPHSNTPTISDTASSSRRPADVRTTPTVLAAAPLSGALPLETTVNVALHPTSFPSALVAATRVETTDANTTSANAKDSDYKAHQPSGVVARATSVHVPVEPIDTNSTDTTTSGQRLSRVATSTTSPALFAPALGKPADANSTTTNGTNGATDLLPPATRPSASVPVDGATRTTPSIGAPSHVFATLLNVSLPPPNATTSSATTPSVGFLSVDTGDALSQRDIVAMAVAFALFVACYTAFCCFGCACLKCFPRARSSRAPSSSEIPPIDVYLARAPSRISYPSSSTLISGSGRAPAGQHPSSRAGASSSGSDGRAGDRSSRLSTHTVSTLAGSDDLPDKESVANGVELAVPVPAQPPTARRTHSRPRAPLVERGL